MKDRNLVSITGRGLLPVAMSPGRRWDPIQRALETFVEEADHSSLSSVELRMHESTLVFLYALMPCDMMLNITQGHRSTHMTFCELLFVTISESVLLVCCTGNIVKGIITA
jgi:hypothetical protein